MTLLADLDEFVHDHLSFAKTSSDPLGATQGLGPRPRAEREAGDPVSPAAAGAGSTGFASNQREGAG